MVVHPLLAESVTQFQAQAYKELLPPSGPVRTQIVGAITPEVQDQAERVKDYMNYQITTVMKEYDTEMDQLLFYLPLSGSAFKKVYFCPIMKRAVAKFVTSEDLVVNYMATDLETINSVSNVPGSIGFIKFENYNETVTALDLTHWANDKPDGTTQPVFDKCLESKMETMEENYAGLPFLYTNVLYVNKNIANNYAP